MEEAIKLLGNVVIYSYDEDGDEVETILSDYMAEMEMKNLIQDIAAAVNADMVFDV